MSFKKQVDNVVNDIQDLKNHYQLIRYWTYTITEILEEKDAEERKRILNNIYSVSIRMDKSISKRHFKDKFYRWIQAGFTALCDQIQVFESKNKLNYKTEMFWNTTEKIMEILIKSIVRHSRRWNRSVNAIQNKYEIQHLLKPLEEIVLGGVELVKTLKSEQDKNWVNMNSIVIAKWSLRINRYFKSNIVKLYNDNIENNNWSAINPLWTPYNWNFKKLGNTSYHMWNLKIHNKHVWDAIIDNLNEEETAESSNRSTPTKLSVSSSVLKEINDMYNRSTQNLYENGLFDTEVTKENSTKYEMTHNILLENQVIPITQNCSELLWIEISEGTQNDLDDEAYEFQDIDFKTSQFEFSNQSKKRDQKFTLKYPHLSSISSCSSSVPLSDTSSGKVTPIWSLNCLSVSSTSRTVQKSMPNPIEKPKTKTKTDLNLNKEKEKKRVSIWLSNNKVKEFDKFKRITIDFDYNVRFDAKHTKITRQTNKQILENVAEDRAIWKSKGLLKIKSLNALFS